MLRTRYNENGIKILCDLANIKQLEEAGYKYKESPVNPIKSMDTAALDIETKDDEIESKKPVKRRARKTSQPLKTKTKETMEDVTKDIILN